MKDLFKDNEPINSLEAYDRRKQDSFLVQLTATQAELKLLNERYEELNRLLTELLAAQAAEKQEQAIAKALEQAELTRQLAQRDLIARVGSITLTFLGIILGAWLRQILPNYFPSGH